VIGRARAPHRPLPPRVLIIVQNLPVPFDRRVWLECRSLRDAGYVVTVICPQGQGTHARQVVDGVRIFAYPPRTSRGGKLGYLVEYAYSFLATAALALRARRDGRFDVVQACNPPDIFWPLARWLRHRDGSRFVFDHHDLCPELYASRFGVTDGRSSLADRGLRALERETFKAADRVIATNASYARVARHRGHVPADKVTVVRTGPDLDRLRRTAADPALRRGRKHLVAYLGVMGPQDGVGLAVEAAALVVHALGRRDISFTFMGAGDCYDEVVALRNRLGLEDFLDLPGRVSDDVVCAVLSSADVGLSPDPRNALNDVSTMNKTLEYMAFGLPVLAFDLHETRVSADQAAVYVEPNSVDAYAHELVRLIDDPARRSRMGRLGRERIHDELAWAHQAKAYVAVYEGLLRRPAPTGGPAVREPRPVARASSGG
jgi:glycosyltransferase involved in cell wall biosynthesis